MLSWLVLSKSEILIMVGMVCWPVSSNEWKAPQVPLNGIQYPEYGISAWNPQFKTVLDGRARKAAQCPN